MATYVVGDVQGCLAPLRDLLDRVRFDPGHDRLWLVGDLVNRGPDSLGTLRFVQGLGEAAITVLGNHDLHLLAILLGGHQPGRKDDFGPILEAPDRERLTDWLRSRRLIHFDPALETLLVHAGVPFVFSLEQALALGREVEAVLRGEDARSFLAVLYGNEPAGWDDALVGRDRWRVVVNYFTRMRFIDAQGRLEFASKEGLASAPAGFFPWFDRLHPDFAARRIAFGHWAALEGRGTPSNCLALDTGCVWGRHMTLLRLEDGVRYCRDCGPES
ncbi:MAG: symmetrical bis(5'-nucleosyl)-tetraphosphatase [Pseudomonadales bacterium]|jgi:bis(5'-nucleosyl)-tetraphosphatase (symmetrical)|nr:symmetrical bis(5'-nucleosyl)-tetraphosphatase [Pseudomonadales bacterium]